MIRLFLVRHGETIWHAENRYAGRTDIPLNAEGEQQARQLAVWAQDAGLTRLYVSPLLRARQTMSPVEQVLDRHAEVDARLRELDFGDCEGLTAAEIATRFPEQYAAFLGDPVHHPLPGGEPPSEAVARGRAALLDIAREAAHEGQDRRVLVVFHNTLIRLLLCDSLGLPPSRYRELFPRLGNVALTELGFQFGAPTRVPIVSFLRFNAPLSLQMTPTSTPQRTESRLT